MADFEKFRIRYIIRIMQTNIHEFVLQRLAQRHVMWTKVSRETGVPYETLKKIASGRTPNPGVRHVQALADYFQSFSQAESDTNLLLDAIEPVEQEVAHG